MSTVHGTASVNPNEDSYEFTLEDVERQWIGPVWEDKALVLADGSPDLDEAGQPKTEKVMVTPSRIETLEEAVRRTFIRELTLDELTSSVEYLRVELSYTIRGSLSLELESYDLDSFGFEGVAAEDIEEMIVQDNLNEYIVDAILEDANNSSGWGTDVEYDIDEIEAT